MGLRESRTTSLDRPFDSLALGFVSSIRGGRSIRTLLSAAMGEERLEIDSRAREKRLYDRLRARVVASAPGARSGLRDLILLLPDMVVLLGRLAADSRVPFRCKVIALAGVSYALSPLDLLPDLLLGPFGLLDDLLVVTAALSHILNHVHPDLVRAHWSGQEDVLLALRRVTAWAESWLGSAISKVLGFRTTPLSDKTSSEQV